MLPDLKGSGILAFSDPAGAKACLALTALLNAGPRPPRLRLFSNKSYDFYAHWPTPVSIVAAVTQASWADRPDWVFTGTSHPDSSGGFEVAVLQAAAEANIPSWAFVDHWTNMALRFQKPDGNLVLPDHIGVLDRMAYDAALQERLPPERLFICPNPYLEYIAKLWRPAVQREAILREAGLPQDTAYVLYAPDPISLRNDDGAWYFNELTALEDIAFAMEGLPTEVALIIKTHPLQPAESIFPVLNGLRARTMRALIQAPAVDNLDLALEAKAVIGFHSNFLLEAAALEKAVLRYFPASGSKDALAHLQIGQKITGREELKASLTDLFLI